MATSSIHVRLVGKAEIPKKPKAPKLPDNFFSHIKKKIKGVEVKKEYAFHPVRKWRFDYAFPNYMVAVEVDGGVWTGGRHINPAGYINDMEKLNTAASMGWLVLRITTDDRFASKTIKLIKTTLKLREKFAEQ